MRSVLHQGDGGFALEQVITKEDGTAQDLSGLSVSFRLRMEFDSTNVVDDNTATIPSPPTAGKVHWNVSIPANAPLGLADGMWVFSNGQQVPAGQFLIEKQFAAGTGGVGVPLASYALTDIPTVKSRISGMRGQNTVADQLLAYLINAASYEMMEYCGREIKPYVPNPSTRLVWLPTNGYAKIPDLQALTSPIARLNPDGSDGLAFAAPTSTTPGDYSLAGYWRSTGTFTALEFQPVSFVSPWAQVMGPAYAGAIKVTGNWGWASVPPNITYLAVMTVKAWYEDDRVVPQAFTEELGNVPDVGTVALPSAVRAALNRYRDIPV